jgi:hypothetical protein
MRRIVIIVICLAALAACAQYSLVEAGKRKIGGTYTVETQIAWNKSNLGKVETWTINGLLLESVYFFKGLADGNPLFERPRGIRSEIEFPIYRDGMTANEVMEFVVDSIARAGASDVQASKLRPMQFGSVPGFRFDLSFLTEDGLEKSGVAAGATIEDELHLILYTGARAYYFPKYLGPVENLIGSIEMI